MLILYFSGTGNTKHIARLFSKAMAAGCFSIEDGIAFNDAISAHDVIAFCYPIYGSRAPLIMRAFVAKHMEALKGKKLIILVSQVLFSGDGARALTDLFPEGHIEVLYAEHFLMPNNVCNVAFVRQTSERASQKRFIAAQKKIDRIRRDLQMGVVKRRGFSAASRLLGRIQGKPWQGDSKNAFAEKNTMEGRAMRGIKISGRCTACGLCVRACPMNNLERRQNRISHKNNCTACFRCVNLCPRQAITVIFHKKPTWQYQIQETGIRSQSMNDWTELCVKVSAGDIDRAGEIAHMVVPYGIYIEDYRDLEEEADAIARIDLIDDALLGRDRTTGVVHVYLPPHEHPREVIAFLRERYAAAGISHEITTCICKNEDWENNWKAYFHPISVGERLLIQPAWEAPADPKGRAVILLEPGLAFGSGSHATTRLCMELLEECVKPGGTVLDIGCGSGILSIAAIKLGAARVLGVDIDPLAVQNARENAARNSFGEDRAAFILGDLVSSVEGTFDIIVSNIVADVILNLSTRMSAYLSPDGVWICSGIIDKRADEALESYMDAGFELVQRKEEDGWVCLALQLAAGESK